MDNVPVDTRQELQETPWLTPGEIATLQNFRALGVLSLRGIAHWAEQKKEERTNGEPQDNRPGD